MTRSPPRPRSIAARQTLGALILVLVAVILGAVIITLALHRFVRAQIDQRLDLQLTALTAALHPNQSGQLELRGGLDAPPFDRPHHGWSWHIETPDRTFTSSRTTTFTPDSKTPPHHHDRPHPGPSGSLAGEDVVSRTLTTTIADQPVTLTATAPARAVRDPLRDVLTPVLLTLVALGLLLGLGSVVTLRRGLRPLTAMRRAIEDVRHGRRDRLPDEPVRELAPLVAELNALLDENAEGLRRARGHVANLGHALKTPLTGLALSLEPADTDRRRLVDEMQRSIRHHLGRARAGAAGAPLRVRTPVRPRLCDLVAALQKIHAARDLTLDIDVPADLAVACEPQDLDEMLGNLLDNACKWATRRVRVSTTPSGRTLALTVEDDGAGLPLERVPEALQPGRRLDESVPGDGFGLTICRELAELYGGDLRLDRSPLGGLSVNLTLPT